MKAEIIIKLLLAGCLMLVRTGGEEDETRTSPANAAVRIEEQAEPEPSSAGSTQETVSFRLEVRSSPQAQAATSMELPDSKWAKAWAKRTELNPPLEGLELAERLLPLSDTSLVLQAPEGSQRLALIAPNVLAEPGSGKQWTIGSSAWSKLKGQALELRARHYGTLLDWGDAQVKLPRKSVFQVIDLETGLTFRVQRRAGSQHADVQPMTKADTAVMKQIYGGEWSWKRRAILAVPESGERLAASMHGMPHGGDGIPGNNFSGHFCIHFRGSTTHKSDSIDLAHQLMAHKAAGRLIPYLEGMGPQELTAALLEGLGQHDRSIVDAAAVGLAPEARGRVEREFGAITGIKLDKPEQADRLESELSQEVHLKALVSRRGHKPVKLEFTAAAERTTLESPWRLTDFR